MFIIIELTRLARQVLKGRCNTPRFSAFSDTPITMKPFLFGLALLGFVSVSGSATAASITIPDYSFETPANTTVSGKTTLGTSTGTVGNWTYNFTTLSTGAAPASIKFGTSSSPAPTTRQQSAMLNTGQSNDW